MPPATPRSTSFAYDLAEEVPAITISEDFGNVVDKLISYICKAVDAAYTYDQLRTSFAGHSLRPLVASLSDECHHPAIVAALLAARYQLKSLETDGSGVNDSRALACEFVAGQFLTFLSDKELMDYLLYELPQTKNDGTEPHGTPIRSANRSGPGSPSLVEHESAPLLQSRPTEYDHLVGPGRSGLEGLGVTGTGTGLSQNRIEGTGDLQSDLAGMNALEIGLVCDAKKFISSHPVQKIVTDVWNGDIVFWESLSVHAQKKPVVYKERKADPFIRLRVPKYQKAFQVLFFLLVGRRSRPVVSSGLLTRPVSCPLLCRACRQGPAVCQFLRGLALRVDLGLRL